MSILSKIRRFWRPADDASYEYPLQRENHRIFPPGYDGLIFVWDIDKTYLASEIDSLRGMLKIPFEFAVDKRTIAGADNLLRLLRRPKQDSVASGIYFVSASPNQLRGTIEKKMLLDGVEHDGITLKDWSTIVRSVRMAKLREQIGYKLSALLLGRRDLGWRAKEVLFGDDSESDALIYSLYADICAGHLRGPQLQQTLLKNGVANQDAVYIVGLCDDLPQQDLVERIYIHTEHASSVAAFTDWNPRLVACRDTFQMTCCLIRDGHLDGHSLRSQASSLAQTHKVSQDTLSTSIHDLVSRQELSPADANILVQGLETALGDESSDDARALGLELSHAAKPRSGPVTPDRFLA